jgi:uncharacterized SAM-binding protein YcdF (DUF218 family)
MSWLFTQIISALLLPPLNLLLLFTLGFLLWHKRPVVARVMVALSLLLLWVLSTPFFAEALLHGLEGSPYVPDTRKLQAEAIVVLGGGTYFHAPEYGGDTVSSETLERLRYAAKLQRETGKPILVTGGTPAGNRISEGDQMKQVLEQDFKVPVQWVEGRSDNTDQNARYSREMLKQAGIDRIYLVTHASHMPRAVLSFQRAGFKVVPAPTAYTTRYQTDALAFIPNAKALRNSRIFLHELIGLFWYQLKS